MTLFRLPIHHTFGPHVTLGVALHSLALLFQPWKWRNGRDRELLREALQRSFGGQVFLFSQGREALAALLRALKLQSGEEVIIQAYTCVVVPNAIHAAGAVPVYADVDGDTLNLDIADVERRITPRTRAIIAQHTFGIPADLKRLRSICDARGIVLIEDCAHVLPEDPDSPVSKTGDYAMLSFGRDKAISGVSGGAVIARKPGALEGLRSSEQQADELPVGNVLCLLLYPLIYRKARVLYCIGLGRIYLALCRKLHLLMPIVKPEEKRGETARAIRKCPNACAALAGQSLRNLPRINGHRRMLTRFYMEESANNGWHLIPTLSADLALQKFPLFFPDADRMRTALRKSNIHLQDGWMGCVLCPRGTDTQALGYTIGSDPQAECVGKGILSLPTHPTMTLAQARRLVAALRELLQVS